MGITIYDLGDGGARAKAGKKNSTATRPGKKKLNSTTRKKKKLNSTTWKKKKTQLNNLEEKKNHHGLYARLQCPGHGDTWLLHTIYVQITNYFEEAT